MQGVSVVGTFSSTHDKDSLNRTLGKQMHLKPFRVGLHVGKHRQIPGSMYKNKASVNLALCVHFFLTTDRVGGLGGGGGVPVVPKRSASATAASKNACA